MKIVIERFSDDGKATLGTLWLDGKFECFTVEDTYRGTKVRGKTRVPAGHYDVKLRDEGGMTKRYADKFPGLHKGMLWLQGVPGFEWVYLHIGNKPEHSEGCILCTSTADKDLGAGGRSSDAYATLYAKVVDAAERGDLRIHIIDRDREAA
jgi:hypothetical protein